MVVAVIIALLAFAAWRDIATRSIPDSISAAIVFLGLTTRLIEGWEPVSVSIGVAIALFMCLLPLQARGLLGGADLKLLSALALGLSPFTTWRLVTIVTLCGAGLAVVYLALRFILNRRRPPHARHRPGRGLALRIAAVEAWRIRRGAPLPYGLAIAAGTALTVMQGWT